MIKLKVPDGISELRFAEENGYQIVLPIDKNTKGIENLAQYTYKGDVVILSKEGRDTLALPDSQNNKRN